MAETLQAIGPCAISSHKRGADTPSLPSRHPCAGSHLQPELLTRITHHELDRHRTTNPDISQHECVAQHLSKLGPDAHFHSTRPAPMGLVWHCRRDSIARDF